MRALPLQFARPGSWVALRDLQGDDEESVQGTRTRDAVALLNRLLVACEGAALGPGEAALLAAPDRDRLLAAVFQGEFGSRIECTVACERCGKPFDLDFRLDELIASIEPSISVEADGTLRLDDGRRVRLPRGEDELALEGVGEDRAPAELLRRCMVEGEAAPDDPAVLDALEAAGPVLDLDLDASCAECGAPQQVRFGLQQYLLGTLLQEARLRISEFHRLAATYGWPLGEILGLDRRRRRAFVAEIERDAARAGGG